jgi:hypothetical protein
MARQLKREATVQAGQSADRRNEPAIQSNSGTVWSRKAIEARRAAREAKEQSK